MCWFIMYFINKILLSCNGKKGKGRKNGKGKKEGKRWKKEGIKKEDRVKKGREKENKIAQNRENIRKSNKIRAFFMLDFRKIFATSW